MDLAKAIRQSLEFWNNPPLTELPPETVTNVANRCVSERFLDLDLTPDACFLTVKSNSFSFGSIAAREYPLSFLDDISRVVRVESRSIGSSTDDDWEEERVSSFENWNDITERGDGNYCAFYGAPDNLTLVVNRDVSNLEFRIIYKQLQSRIETPSDLVSLPDVCETLLVFDMALEYGELIDNQSPEFLAKKRDKMPYLAGRRDDAMKRFEKWRRNQRGLSVTTRRSFSDRQDFKTGARKFTVNF